MKKYFNKTIFKLIFVFGIIAVVAFGVTRAFFSDTETSKDNVLQAGKLDLQIDNTSYYNGAPSPETSWELNDLTDQLFFNFLDLKPGDWGEDTISIHVDDNDAWACLDISITEDDDESCNEPELKDDPTCDDPDLDPDDGELAGFVNFIFWADDGDNVLEADEVESIFKKGDVDEVFNGQKIALSDALGGVLGLGGPLEGGTTYYIGKAWCFGELTTSPVAAGQGVDPTVDDGITCDGSGLNNAAQTDKVLVDFEFSAYQHRNNESFTCSGERPSITPTVSITVSPTPPLSCQNADVMLVLDRSGSIDSGEMASLKTAAKSFVDTLALSASGNHAGQSSFSTTGSLDHHLTDNPVSLKVAIDALASTDWTNLKEGIDYAKGELDNPGDGHDRPDVSSPDKMVIITDGNPNRPLSPPAPDSPDVAAANAATAAKGAGVEIFVVGIGSDVDATYLTNSIASAGAGHYYSADYSGLQTILDNLDLCNGD